MHINKPQISSSILFLIDYRIFFHLGRLLLGRIGGGGALKHIQAAFYYVVGLRRIVISVAIIVGVVIPSLLIAIKRLLRADTYQHNDGHCGCSLEERAETDAAIDATGFYS